MPLNKPFEAEAHSLQAALKVMSAQNQTRFPRIESRLEANATSLELLHARMNAL